MEQLNILREQISQIDIQIIQLLAKRQELSLDIGRYKKTLCLPIYDAMREKELKEKHRSIAMDYNVSLSTIEQVFNLIIEESRKVQQ